MAREIGRVLTAMVTPFDDAGRVDYGQAKRLAQALVASGSDGVVVSGTTGESPTLTTEEKLHLFVEIRGALAGKGSVVAGTGNYSTHESIELSKAVVSAGVDAIMAVVPYYNKPPQDGLYLHFKAIAESVPGMPLILYNVPSRTAQNMSAETIIKLSHIDNVVGVKEAGGDMNQVARTIDGAKHGFKVWSGNDNETFFIMTLGGYGIISVASHLIGLQIKQMIGYLLDGHLEKAAAEHRRLLPMFNGLFPAGVANPIAVKYLVNKIGFKAGPFRLPMVPPDAKTAAELDALMATFKVDLPVSVKA